MILLLAAASCVAAASMRLGLGSWSAAVPWCGLAWTVLFARRSRLGSFVGLALVLGVVDGIFAPARWTAWPMAYLAAGILAFSTRRILPVRSPAGEALLGALATALVRIAAAPFQPFDLPAAPSHSPAILIEAAMTGLATGALVWLAARWDPLRMRLAKVS